MYLNLNLVTHSAWMKIYHGVCLLHHLWEMSIFQPWRAHCTSTLKLAPSRILINTKTNWQTLISNTNTEVSLENTIPCYTTILYCDSAVFLSAPQHHLLGVRLTAPTHADLLLLHTVAISHHSISSQHILMWWCGYALFKHINNYSASY